MRHLVSIFAFSTLLGCVTGGPGPVASSGSSAGKADESETPDTGTASIEVTASVVSLFSTSYPFAYVALAKTRFYENYEALDVFDVRGVDAQGDRWGQRIESYYTGGDWMENGVVYFLLRSNGETAFEIAPFSTPDKEEGETPPAIEYSQAAAIELIKTSLFDSEGNVTAAFSEDAEVRAALEALVR